MPSEQPRFLTLPDFWLFTALNKHLKGVYFSWDEEVQALAENSFMNTLKNFTPISWKNFFSAGSVVSN
jgi:hypothetical protein